MYKKNELYFRYILPGIWCRQQQEYLISSLSVCSWETTLVKQSSNEGNPRWIVQWLDQRWRYQVVFQVRLLLVALAQYVLHSAHSLRTTMTRTFQMFAKNLWDLFLFKASKIWFKMLFKVFILLEFIKISNK